MRRLLEDLVRRPVDQFGVLHSAVSLVGSDLKVSFSAPDRRPQKSGRLVSDGWLLDEDSVDSAVQAAEHFDEAPLQPDPPSRLAELVHPLRYADQQIGALHLKWRTRSDRRDAQDTWLAGFSRRCAAVIQRYEVQAWTAARLGKPLLLVGMSEALRGVESFIERAVSSELPVLLTGEFGTEKPLLAAAVHCQGSRRDAPFVEVNCAEPFGSPERWFKAAEGGTLFLNGVEELSPRLQSRLPLHMKSRLGQWLTGPDASDVRIIASTTLDLEAQVDAGLFSRRLLSEFDVLSTTVPPLRDRPGDIEALVGAALNRLGYLPEDKVSAPLLAAFRAYAWPENLVELERVVARLAVMTDSRRIEWEDIARYAPRILNATTGPIEAPPQPVQAPSPQDAPSIPPFKDAEYWIQCAIRGEGAQLAELHEALAKSLMFLGEHYVDAISFETLTRRVYVSPSHLSFLFRTELGMPFKQVLTRIRIQKACDILLAQPRRQVTDVAISVGFADLSHFEKSFRRIVGKSPREFRRQTVNGLAAEVDFD